MRTIIRLSLLFTTAVIVLCGDAAAVEPVKIFLLAGQSNMVGHGRVEIGNGSVDGAIGSLRYQVNNDPANYGHLVDSNGDWVVRDDVWYYGFTTADGVEKGNLTVGFGAADFNIGPEFGFGHVMGDYYDEQVLVIKTAWGGRSLGADFRPPSAVAKRGGTVGFYYDEMLRIYNEVVDDIATEFPGYQGQGVELAGFGWHQGYNDRFDNNFANEYEANLADLIRDVRNDLGAPQLPFVVTETGNGGFAETNANSLKIMAAQAAVADASLYPDFAGNVGFVATRGFWRATNVSPTSAGHHWNANGESYYLMGHGMGVQMVSLVPEPGAIGLGVMGLLIVIAKSTSLNRS